MLRANKYYIIKLLISTSLILWFFHKANFTEIFNSLRLLSLWIFFIVYIAYFINLFISAYKWHILIPQESIYELYYLNLISVYYSMILPGQVTGEAIKALRLGRGKVDAEKIAVSVVVDKITGIIALTSIGVLGLLLTDAQIPFIIILTLVIIIILLILLIISLRYDIIFELANRFISFLNKRYTYGIMDRIKIALSAWHIYAKKNKLLLLNGTLGIGVHLITIFIYMEIALKMGIAINFVDWCWIVAILSLALFLPISIGGIGVREASLVGTLSLFGITAEKALAFSFALFAISLGVLVIGFISEAICLKSN